mmetsp:Transcript_30671/g.47755  ORF Transcript_30671/g.47755 Transcript_30671/m.47755 type:complete len:125 (+) Transcript_30671:239-613(+)
MKSKIKEQPGTPNRQGYRPYPHALKYGLALEALRAFSSWCLKYHQKVTPIQETWRTTAIPITIVTVLIWTYPSLWWRMLREEGDAGQVLGQVTVWRRWMALVGEEEGRATADLEREEEVEVVWR